MRLIIIAQPAAPGSLNSFSVTADIFLPVIFPRPERTMKSDRTRNGKSDGITDEPHMPRPLRTPSIITDGSKRKSKEKNAETAAAKNTPHL